MLEQANAISIIHLVVRKWCVRRYRLIAKWNTLHYSLDACVCSKVLKRLDFSHKQLKIHNFTTLLLRSINPMYLNLH